MVRYLGNISIQVGGVVGWLSVQDPEEVGAPQVFLSNIFSLILFFSQHVFLNIHISFNSLPLSSECTKCDFFLSRTFHIKPLQNFKKIGELDGRAEEEQEHENSVLAVKISIKETRKT